jgi:ferric-dicitrate binding protein FerR (iron transport regulator)
MKKETSLSSDNVDQQAFRIAFLIAGFLQDRLSPEEHRELDDWVTASMENQRLFEELTDPAILVAGKADLQKSRPDELLEHVKSRMHFTEPPRPSLFRRIWPYMAAACLLIGVLLFWVKMQNKNSHLDKVPAEWAAKDLPPGSNKATLTLADGTSRQLDSSAKGMLATQGGAFVMKDDSDRLVYETGTSNPTAEPVFNILRVPRGGQYQLRLPDGTKVWLNADSYLKYPTTFTGKDRKVELSGEGYFEVTQDPHHPFIVQTESVETQVLGTNFNINTYPEKKTIQITLAQGAVKVIPSGSSQKGQPLVPGQQAQVDRLGGTMKIVPANLVTTLAWKDGLFIFQHTSLEEVLSQISRWYNVNATDSTTDTNHFNASIPRNVPVSRLLHMLEQTKQVHFRIDPDKITATN